MNIKTLSADKFIDEISLFRHIEKTIITDEFMAGLDLPDEREPFESLPVLADTALQTYYTWQNMLHGDARVTVAVVGEFSSGKSSFINSLLQKEVCVATDKPTTAVLTRFVYGDAADIYILDEYKARAKRVSEKDYKKLSQHSPDNQNSNAGVSTIFEYQYPFDNLRNVVLYDTPGYSNATHTDDEQITSGLIKDVDMLIFLIDVQKGDIGSTMLEKVKEWKKQDKRICLVINKSDLKSPKDREAVQDSLSKKYSNIFDSIVLYSSKNELSRADGYMTESTQREEPEPTGVWGFISKYILRRKRHVKQQLEELPVVKSLSGKFISKRGEIIKIFESIREKNKVILDKRFSDQYKRYVIEYKTDLSRIIEILNNIALEEKEFASSLNESTETFNQCIDSVLAALHSCYVDYYANQIDCYSCEEVTKNEKSYWFTPYYKIVGDTKLAGEYTRFMKNRVGEISAFYKHTFDSSFLNIDSNDTELNELLAQVMIAIDKDLPALSVENMRIPGEYFDNDKEASNNLQYKQAVHEKWVNEILDSHAHSGVADAHSNLVNELKRVCGLHEGEYLQKIKLVAKLSQDISQFLKERK